MFFSKSLEFGPQGLIYHLEIFTCLLGFHQNTCKSPKFSEFSQRRLFCLRRKLFCCSVPHVCPLNREEKCSVQVSRAAVRKLLLCCVEKHGGMQQGRGGHHTGYLFLFGSDVLLSLNAPLHSAALSELPPMKYAGKEKVGSCQLSLHAHMPAHPITNLASSCKSECLCTSRLKCGLPTLWAAAAKCPAHALFYESLASVRLYYYYSLS